MLIGPSRHIEQRKPLLALCQAVATLNARAPPFAEVATGTELAQILSIRLNPFRKAEVIFLRSDPARTTAGHYRAVFGDVNLGIRSIDFFCDRALAVEAGDLRKRLKFKRHFDSLLFCSRSLPTKALAQRTALLSGPAICSVMMISFLSFRIFRRSEEHTSELQ